MTQKSKAEPGQKKGRFDRAILEPALIAEINLSVAAAVVGH